MENTCQNIERYDPDNPYSICVDCLILAAKRCDGPNPLAMEPKHRCEFLQRRQKFLKRRDDGGWSYEHIAAKTKGVSKATVMRVMNDPLYDPGAFTLGEVMRVLVDGTWGQFPCGIHAHDEEQVVYVDSPETLAMLESANLEITKLQNEIAEVKAEMQKKVDYLLAEGERKSVQIEKKDAVIEKLLYLT